MANEEVLKQEIKKGKANCFMLYGKDGFLKKMYLEKITKPIADFDDVFNYQRFENTASLQEIYDAVLQFPVLTDKKCVILRDFDFQNALQDDFEKLLTIISEVPQETVFILWFDALEFEVKKNAKFDKLLKAFEAVGGCPADLEHRTSAELEKMLLNGAVKRGCKMEITAARLLIEAVGEDIDTLKNELEKLCCFADGGVITKETVKAVATETVESNVYKLTEKILKCDLAAAYKMLDALFFMRIEPIIILSTISAVYVDMYRVLAAKSHNFSTEKTASDFAYGNRKFALRDASYNLKGFDFNKLNLSFQALTKADKQLKSFGENDKAVLEQLAVKLSYIASKGESLD